MDSSSATSSLHFDDAPRTPSPPTVHRYTTASPHNYKADLVDPVRIFSQDDDVPSAYPSPAAHWQQPAPRPSLLQELYEQDSNAMSSPEHPSPPDMYVQDDWPQAAPPQQQQQRAPHDYTLIRRATFPYARQERPEDVPMASYPPFLYNNDGTHSHHHAQMPLTAEPGALHSSHHGEGAYSYDPQVKVEHEQHAQMQYHPPPPQFYRPPPPPHHAHPSHHAHPHAPHPYAHPAHHPSHLPHGHHGMGGGIMHPTYPTHGLPVQHTDDAASKETQYLRRRCFNCHTTEPPSWRRSTLNPGKIVCNKCGLYERTHLRARPLRFDELRAGNKARKGAGKGGVGSPKQPGMGVPGGVPVKRAGGIARRSSVSSTGSSAQSGSGASDWDDSVSVYSNGSAPPTSFSSPNPGAGFSSPVPPSLSLSSHSSNHSSPGGRDSRSPPLLNGSISAHHVGSPPGSANSYNGAYPAVGSPHIGSPHLNGGAGIRLPHAPEIPTLVRTKPRSNTTGGLHSHTHSAHHIGVGAGAGQQQQQMYYSPPLPAHHGGLHHSSSNSSLHSTHSQHSPSMAPSSLLPDGGVGGGQGQHELYRRGSLPDFHASFNGGMGGEWGADDGMGVSVKEEPRAVVV